MEIPIKMDDLGVPPFFETPKCVFDLLWGRLMALFRHGRCQERVRHFGASAYGAAAVAQNSGGKGAFFAKWMAKGGDVF